MKLFSIFLCLVCILCVDSQPGNESQFNTSDFALSNVYTVVFDTINQTGNNAFFYIMDGLEVMSVFSVYGPPTFPKPGLNWTDPNSNTTLFATLESEGAMIINNITTTIVDMEAIFDDVQSSVQNSSSWNALALMTQALGNELATLFQNDENAFDPPEGIHTDAASRGSSYPSISEIFLPMFSLGNLAYSLLDKAIDNFVCADPRKYTSNCPAGWRITYAATKDNIYDPVNQEYVYGGGECNGMCGPGCCCWVYVCGDCCVRPPCLFHDVVSCSAGIASYRCWADGFTMFETGGIFGYTCATSSWKNLDPNKDAGLHNVNDPRSQPSNNIYQVNNDVVDTRRNVLLYQAEQSDTDEL